MSLLREYPKVKGDTLVFVSGPYERGDTIINVREALTYGDAVAKLGVTPIIPHLFHFWHFLYPHSSSFWMEMDIHLLRNCHILLRIPGHSPGADRECAVAEQLDIDIVKNIIDLELLIGEKYS